MHHTLAAPGKSAKNPVPFFCLAVFLLACSATSNAQNDAHTPLGLKAGAPAGSYPLSDIDNVNLFNGVVNIRIPLWNIGGRGEAKSQMSFTWDSPMRWQVYKSEDPFGNPMYGAGLGSTRPDGTVSYGFHSGEISAYPVGVGSGATNWCAEGLYVWQTTLTRMFWTDPDGTEHEMRDVLTGGQPLTTGGCWSVGPNRGRVFVSTDGSGATFIADEPIRDGIYVNMEFPNDHDWYGWLLFRDGGRVRISYDNNRSLRDRNGNLVSTAPSQPVKDSLNRTTGGGNGTSTECHALLPGSIGCSYISYKGFGGAERKLWSTTDANYRTSAIFLPNGRSYRLYYSQYDDLIRIDLPTGGSIEYEYGPGLEGPQPPTLPMGPPGVYSDTGPNDFHIYRRVTERRVYREGHVLESRQTFSKPEDVYGNNLGYVDKKQFDTADNLLSTERHYFFGSADASFDLWPTQYSPWTHGREYRTDFYDSDGVLMRKVEHTWQQRAPVAWWTGGAATAPSNDSRISQTISYLENNMYSRTTYGYDPTVPYNSLTDVHLYDFTFNLMRRTQTTYLKNQNGFDYTGSNIQSGSDLHSRDLPLQLSVYDSGGTERSRTTFEYDNYNSDSNHAPLTPRTSISGLDPAYTTSYVTRGNVTATTNYLLTNGAVTGSISTYAQYDVAGNVVKVIDGRGYATTYNFADRFGTPDGEARLNPSLPPELGAQKTYAFPTLATNAQGHSSYVQRDYYTGGVVDAEDANGVTSSGYYADALDRPTKVIWAADDLTLHTQTSFSYDDVNRIITTTADHDGFNDPTPLKSLMLYDGLGRTVETRQYETSTAYITVKQTYDALGRPKQVSNPYRSGQTVLWTTRAYDDLGRVISVTTPDNAVVSTSYSANTVTVTDQAGKSRKNVADALGRLKQVYEDPTGLNYLTTYIYDVLDNLITISQGVQTRTYAYDSLKRLKSATNPENGTVSYTHDNNGNLLTRTDARSIITTFTYDSLNRPTLKNYSDTTPDVAFFYDAQTLPAGAPSFVRGSSTGRLVAVTTGGTNAGTYRGFDALGQVVRQYQRTDAVNYLVEATYNHAGAMLTETYPVVPGATGRRTVSYTYDLAGRLASLSSPATTYAPAASVSTVTYAPHGALASQTLGNNLIYAQIYNNRLQSNQIKLGTAANPTSVVNLTYNFGTTNNNGNVQGVTYAGGGLSYTQTFGHDQLNRLTTSQEGSSWSQTNSYDRYGNRSIVGGTLTFNAGNNRITTAGYTYDAAGNLTDDGPHSYIYDAENKISKVDAVSAYVYDGEGNRVRKLLGENLRFIYDMDGKQIAEFDGATGALMKEYIYGVSGLVATIEPMAINVNGTRYTTPDNLGTPRVVTNSVGGVVSRHDYMPFGEELFAGTGGRSVPQGYGGDNLRQKFTSKERDNETGLDYFGARYYASTQGRFTSVDPLRASARPSNPQTWNRYSYVLNRPLSLIDPNGMLDCTPQTPCQYYSGDWSTNGNHPQQGLIEATVTIDISERPSALEAPSISVVENLGLGTGQVASDTAVGAAKFSYNAVAGTANMINFLPDYGLSFFTDFQFGQIELYEASTPGEQGAMYGMMIGGLLAGGFSGMAATEGVLPANVANTFANGYRIRTLQMDVTAYRYSGGRSPAPGRFLTTRQTVGRIGSPAEARSFLNLPSGNNAQTLNVFTIPRGTTIFTGRVAGGGPRATQIFIHDSSVLLSGK